MYKVIASMAWNYKIIIGNNFYIILCHQSLNYFLNQNLFLAFFDIFAHGAELCTNCTAFLDMYYFFSLSEDKLAYSICIFCTLYCPYYLLATSNKTFSEVSTFISSIQWPMLVKMCPPDLYVRRTWPAFPFFPFISHK